jgi:hypothetical protein
VRDKNAQARDETGRCRLPARHASRAPPRAARTSERCLDASTLPMRTLDDSARSLRAASASSGFAVLQWPHQGAVKATSHSPDAVSPSNVEGVSSTSADGEELFLAQTTEKRGRSSSMHLDARILSRLRVSASLGLRTAMLAVGRRNIFKKKIIIMM